MSETRRLSCEAAICKAIVSLFNDTFADDNTVLQGGASEPFFKPAGYGEPAVIRFRSDYIRSALHEVAHWCVAGKERRTLEDYGYWYSPDDRDADEQTAFFAVEARPQALESLFCDAMGLPFTASIDNLTLTISHVQRASFEARIVDARRQYREKGLPKRAGKFLVALSNMPQ